MGTGRGPRRPGALFVNQASRAGLVGPLASWITIAGWAAAAERRYGAAWMATTEGVLDPAGALARATDPVRTAAAVAGWRRRIPQVARTAVNDAKRPRANRRFADTLARGPWDDADVQFVMQLHGLACDAGLRVAERLAVPSVLVVDAVQVEEAHSWGTHRPGWERIALRLGEVPQLRRADLVVCISAEVSESVIRCTGRRTGVVTIPNGVDTELFSPGPADAGLRHELGLDDAFVVGWAGSFRRFHGLETLVDAAAVLTNRVPNLRVLLLGDGFQRAAIEERARARGVDLVLPGTIAYTRVPEYLRCMDAAVVLADPARTFHYSPVKLREYQACGLPVVASGIGEMARDLHGDVDARLVPPGDVAALADALQRLHGEPAGARRLAAAGRAQVEANGSWTSRLVEVERLLGIQPPT